MTTREVGEVLPRPLSLEGASNVRDLGGWPAADGRLVRFGQVFRSASLARLTEADGEALRAVGIGVVCDLRGDAEQAASPSRFTGVTTHALSIEPSLGASLHDIAARGEVTGAPVMALLRRAYVSYALDWSHRYRALFGVLLAEGAPGVLFHCTAGKDRTGFAAALLLTSLGVAWEVVREDYLATNRLWKGDPMVGASLPPAMADILLGAHAELLDVAFDSIRAAHGSVEAYLAERIGLDVASLARLRERLLA